MTREEKFTALSKGCEYIMLVEWRPRNQQDSYYPRTFLVWLDGFANEPYSNSPWSPKPIDFYACEWCWKEIGDRKSRQPISPGKIIEFERRHWPMDVENVRCPVYFITKLVIDKFTMRTEIRSEPDFVDILDDAWKSRNNPEYMFGIIKERGERRFRKMNDLRDLIFEERSYGGKWGTAVVSEKNRYEHIPKSLYNAHSMRSIMHQPPPKKITKATLKKIITRRIMKARRKHKKVSQREQEFFSMLLGAKKFQSLEA